MSQEPQRQAKHLARQTGCLTTEAQNPPQPLLSPPHTRIRYQLSSPPPTNLSLESGKKKLYPRYKDPETDNCSVGDTIRLSQGTSNEQDARHLLAANE